MERHPNLDSNQDLDLQRVQCLPLHHRDSRADDWTCTSICRFTKPVPSYSATSAVSTSARSRTPYNRFGSCLLSQEHTRVGKCSQPEGRELGYFYFSSSAFQ